MINVTKHLKHNWPAKILAIIIATIMWFFIMKEQNPVITASYTVPVQVQNLNAQYIADGVPKEIRVTLQGPRNSILSMNHKLLKAYVDLENLRPGQSNVSIIFNAPSGTTVVDMKPETIAVDIDEYAERQMPVEVIQLGKMKDNMAVKSVTTMPKTVIVSGPKTKVDRVSHVLLHIDMQGQDTNFAQNGKLNAVDNEGKDVSVNISPTQGQAQFELSKISTEKAFPISASLVGNVAPGFDVKNVTITPAQISLSGKEDILNTLTDIKTQNIDISGANANIEGTYNLLIPDGVSSQVTTVKVKVDIGQ